MNATCIDCQQAVQDSDAFCHFCGARIKRQSIVADDDYFPLPGVVGQPDLRIHKTRRRVSKPWYRRPIASAMVLIALILIVGSASMMFQI